MEEETQEIPLPESQVQEKINERPNEDPAEFLIECVMDDCQSLSFYYDFKAFISLSFRSIRNDTSASCSDAILELAWVRTTLIEFFPSYEFFL